MDTDGPDKSRRRLVGGVAAGLLAGVVSPVITQATSNQASALPIDKPGAPVTPPNPVNAYPRPRFQRRQQTWPGLARRMDPAPNHGEKSWTPLQLTGGQPAEKLRSFGEDSPIGRPGQPAALAAIYGLLASPESSYATGQVFRSVGGRGGP